MKLLLSMAAPVLCSGLLIAQNPTTAPNNNMPSTTAQSNLQSYTGLLVASGCDASGAMSSNSAMNSNNVKGASDRMSSDTMPAKTTPGHETSTTYEQTVNQADRNSTTSSSATATSSNRTMNNTSSNSTSSNSANSAEVARNNNSGQSSVQDQRWEHAQRVAHNLPDSCRISDNTSSFALLMPGGRLVRLDDASNTKVRQELQSSDRVKSGKKIFRVVVKGTLQGDTLSMDSIQM